MNSAKEMSPMYGMKDQKERTESIFKQVRNITLLFGAIDIALGVLLILFTEQMSSLIWIILGVASLALGVYRVLRFLNVQRFETVLATELYTGIFFLVFGVLALVHQAFVVEHMVFIFGILLLAGSVIKIQNAIDLYHIRYSRWWIVLILGFISAGLGVLLITEPAFMKEFRMILTGAFLIYDGVSALAAVIMMMIVRRRIRKGLMPGAADGPAGPAAMEQQPVHHGLFHHNSEPKEETVPTPAQDASIPGTVDAEFAPMPGTAPAGPDPFEVPETKPAPKFDPETGEPIVRKPKFDPDTGKPLDVSDLSE